MRTALPVKFPDHQGKNREFSGFRPDWDERTPRKCRLNKGFFSKFPTQRNRELQQANREFFGPIRELSGSSREAVRSHTFNRRARFFTASSSSLRSPKRQSSSSTAITL